jgi:hypothetical protein
MLEVKTEQELYLEVVRLSREVDELIENTMNLSPTIELSLFVGKLAAVLDILSSLEESGAPISDEDEEPRPLTTAEN